MAAIMNGMAAHGGFVPYGGTFLVFSDYARNALRRRVADRPAEHLRADARFDRPRRGRAHAPADRAPREPARDAEHGLWRPADTVETAVAWRAAIERRTGPTSIVLTRQDLPHVQRTAEQVALIARGGYIVSSSAAPPAFTSHRHGLGAAARRRRGARARAVGRRGARRVHAVHASVRPRRARNTAATCCPRAARGSRSKPVRRTVGGGTSPAAAP